jgi:hypothetical protein
VTLVAVKAVKGEGESSPKAEIRASVEDMMKKKESNREL